MIWFLAFPFGNELGLRTIRAENLFVSAGGCGWRKGRGERTVELGVSTVASNDQWSSQDSPGKVMISILYKRIIDLHTT